MSPPKPPAPPLNARDRRVPLARIIDTLMLHACAYEVEAGEHVAARGRCVAAVDGWISNGLGRSTDGRGEPLLDPVEVICFMKWSGATGQDRFWQDHWSLTARMFSTELLKAGTSRFHVTLERAFDLRSFQVGSQIRLRLPIPLVSPYHAVQVARISSPQDDAEVTQLDGRIEVRIHVPSDQRSTIGAAITLDTLSPSNSGQLDLSLSERELYLRPKEDLIRVTPRIATLARRIGGARSDRAAVDAFWNYLMDTVQVAAIRYHELAPETAVEGLLEGGWCDCRLGSALFVSLCRARGLPARLLGGHFLYRLAPTKHYWAEVWLGDSGWLPFDCSSWDLSEGGCDAEWRDRFAGRLEPRLVTECFPRQVTGPMSVRFPAAWQLVQAGFKGGVDASFHNVSDGSIIFRDRVTVLPEG